MTNIFMANMYRTECCGVREYKGVHGKTSPVPVLMDAFTGFYNLEKDDYEDDYGEEDEDGYNENRGWDSGAFIMFTATDTTDTLQTLKAYIEENNLGSAMLSEYRMNPNSGNELRVLIFGVDHDAWEVWYEANTKKAEPKEEALPYGVGSRVVNVGSGRRVGLECSVLSIFGGDVTVVYDNGDAGIGKVRHYKLVS